MNMTTTIDAEYVRQTRERLRYSQTRLAMRLHVTRAAVANYENGRRRIPDDILRGLNKLNAA